MTRHWTAQININPLKGASGPFPFPQFRYSRTSLFAQDAVVTARRGGGKVNTHTLHGGLTRHVDDGVVAAVSEATVPGFKVGSASGVVSRAGGCGGVRVSHARRVEVEAIQTVGLEDSALKHSSTCFVSDPTRVRVKRRNVIARAIKAKDGDEANGGRGDEEHVKQNDFVIAGDAQFN